MISEWDWLKVLLRLEALESRSDLYIIGYQFEEEPRRLIRCTVWAQHTSTMVAARASKQEQLEYYRDWVALEKGRIRRSVAGLPGLRKTFRFSRDVVIHIADAYGMGSAVVCRYSEGKFHWLMEGGSAATGRSTKGALTKGGRKLRARRRRSSS